MGNNNMLVVLVLGVIILFGAGIITWDGNVLAINDTEVWSLGKGSDGTNTTTTTTTTTTTGNEDLSGASTLAVGTGYINSEGEWVFPSEEPEGAQSVYWAGTDDLVVDVGISPYLTVMHSDELASLDSVKYTVTLSQIGAMIEGETSYDYAQYGDFVINTVLDLPAEGGSLGTTSLLEDILGINIDLSGSTIIGEELDTFLWSAMEKIGVSVSEVYLEPGTFKISINIVLVIDSIVIDYSLIDASTGVYETADDVMFTKEVKLDLEFIIPPTGPPEADPTGVITWQTATGSPAIDPDIPTILPSGETTSISITYRPILTQGVASHWEFYKNDYLIDSGSWNGGDVTVSDSVYTKEGMILNYMLKVYATEGSPASYTVSYRVLISREGDDNPRIPIDNVGVTYSVFMPSSGGLEIMTVFLFGGGLLMLVNVCGYWYREKNKVVSVKSRRRKRR
jgi:hypothetical protein